MPWKGPKIVLGLGKGTDPAEALEKAGIAADILSDALEIIEERHNEVRAELEALIGMIRSQDAQAATNLASSDALFNELIALTTPNWIRVRMREEAELRGPDAAPKKLKTENCLNALGVAIEYGLVLTRTQRANLISTHQRTVIELQERGVGWTTGVPDEKIRQGAVERSKAATARTLVLSAAQYTPEELTCIFQTFNVTERIEFASAWIKAATRAERESGGFQIPNQRAAGYIAKILQEIRDSTDYQRRQAMIKELLEWARPTSCWQRPRAGVATAQKPGSPLQTEADGSAKPTGPAPVQKTKGPGIWADRPVLPSPKDRRKGPVK